ncbi:MAG: DUF4159 domain-containing protein [Alphaproteobacteria bacterium]
MKQGNKIYGAILGAAIGLSSTYDASARPGANPPVEPQIVQTQAEIIDNHLRVEDDLGIYAREIFIGHVLHPKGSINTLAQRGLTSLITESYRRSSIEPAGTVGIDLEDEEALANLSAITSMLYFPVTQDTPRLSNEARHALQDYIANGGLIVLDVVGGGRINNSAPLRQIIDDLQIRPPERLEDGHALSQSFYFSDLEGGNNTARVWVETQADHLGEAGASSVIIADQNFARTWYPETADAEEHERAIRSGLNILTYALTGLYKNDPVHAETIEQKREYLEEEERRIRALEAVPAPE